MPNKKFYPYIAQGANAKQMFNIMQACIRAGVPFGLVGNPGVGKTATIEAMSKTLGRELINLSLSTMLPEDIAGLPFPTKINIGSDKKEQMVDAACYAMPVWQQRLLHNSNAILFLDEFSTAIPTTQHAFLQLVQNRRLPGSDLPFSKNVAIIIAMNPADQAGGSSLDLPIANRFAWFTFNPDFNDWATGFKQRWQSEELMSVPSFCTDEKILMARNKKIRSTIIDYLDSEKGAHQVTIVPSGMENPISSVVRRDDPAEMEVFRLAFPSARSWDNLAEIMTYIDEKDFGTIQVVINGTIGSNQGIAFYKYYVDNLKRLNIDAILKDPKSVDWKHISIDESAGIFRALIEEAANGRLDQVLEVFISIKIAGAENLLSGNRLQDIYKAEYLNKLPLATRKKVKQRYLEYFGDFLTKIANNNSGN